jgi:hypothetical protein
MSVNAKRPPPKEVGAPTWEPSRRLATVNVVGGLTN